MSDLELVGVVCGSLVSLGLVLRAIYRGLMWARALLSAVSDTYLGLEVLAERIGVSALELATGVEQKRRQRWEQSKSA
jgi:hypothetical protein